MSHTGHGAKTSQIQGTNPIYNWTGKMVVFDKWF